MNKKTTIDIAWDNVKNRESKEWSSYSDEDQQGLRSLHAGAWFVAALIRMSRVFGEDGVIYKKEADRFVSALPKEKRFEFKTVVDGHHDYIVQKMIQGGFIHLTKEEVKSIKDEVDALRKEVAGLWEKVGGKIVQQEKDSVPETEGPTVFVNEDGSEFSLPGCTCGEFFCDRCQYQKEKQASE